MRGRKEIYTKDFVTKELTWMAIQLKKNKELIFIAELFADKPYTTQRYSEWRNKFKDCEEIQELMAKIEEELECRAVVGGLRSTLNAQFTKFHLVNNYRDKYQERQNTDLHIHLDMAERMRLADQRMKQLENIKPLQIENKEEADE